MVSIYRYATRKIVGKIHTYFSSLFEFDEKSVIVCSLRFYDSRITFMKKKEKRENKRTLFVIISTSYHE